MRKVQPHTGRDSQDDAFAAVWLSRFQVPALRYLPRHEISRPGPGGLRGAEILLGYQALSPSDPDTGSLVAALERIGLGPQLDQLVLKQALTEAEDRLDRRLALLPISVNVGADTLCQPDFAQRLVARLSEHNLPRGAIEIELTERQPIKNMDQARQAVQQLAAAGIRTILDDFGTGHCGSDWLANLPVGGVKISREILLEAEESPTLRERIGEMVTAARRAALTVTVEGIETNAQVAIASSWGATDGQGWRYGRPLAAEDYAARIDAAQNTGGSAPRGIASATIWRDMPPLRLAAARTAETWAALL